MPSRTVRCLLLALLGAPLCAGWTVRKGGVSMTTNSFVTRRGILRALPGVAVLPLASSPSHAVLGGVPSGEGGLPEAARQFDNVVRSQKGWESLGSRIEKGGKAGDKDVDKAKELEAQVLAANEAFYAAYQSKKLSVMKKCWWDADYWHKRGDEAVVVREAREHADAIAAKDSQTGRGSRTPRVRALLQLT